MAIFVSFIFMKNLFNVHNISVCFHLHIVPAHFKSKFSAQTVRKGQQVLIVCSAFGEIPISIVLTKDRMQFDPNLEPRYEWIRSEKTDGFSQTLKIVDCDRRDSALFTCIAANQYGKDEYNVQLIVQGIYIIMILLIN